MNNMMLRAVRSTAILLFRCVRNPRAAIDLASIMVGVLVIGIIGGVISATLFAVIPWAQDEAAKQRLQAVSMAESAHRALHQVYGSGPELEAAGLLEADQRVCVSSGGAEFTAVARSESGSFFGLTSKNPSAKPASAEQWTECSGAPVTDRFDLGRFGVYSGAGVVTSHAPVLQGLNSRLLGAGDLNLLIGRDGLVGEALLDRARVKDSSARWSSSEGEWQADPGAPVPIEMLQTVPTAGVVAAVNPAAQTISVDLDQVRDAGMTGTDLRDAIREVVEAAALQLVLERLLDGAAYSYDFIDHRTGTTAFAVNGPFTAASAEVQLTEGSGNPLLTEQEVADAVNTAVSKWVRSALTAI